MNKSEMLFAEAVEHIPGGVNSPVRAFGSVGETPRFIHISNLNPVDPKTGKATRVGRKVSSEGTLVRYSKKSGEEIK